MSTRDRHARIAATVARGCGFTQRPAVLVVRQLPAVTDLLERDDPTVRRVLDDERLRRALCVDVRDAFASTWRQATLDRVRLDHRPWLERWWLPAATDDELHRLVAATIPPGAQRIGLAIGAFPATIAAAEVLLDAPQRRVVAGGRYLLVERRLADAVRAVARDHATVDVPSDDVAVDGRSAPPDGVDADEHPRTTWWHG